MTTPEQHRRYNNSEKGKARQKRYHATERAKALKAEWERENRLGTGVRYQKKLLNNRRFAALRRRRRRRERGTVPE